MFFKIIQVFKVFIFIGLFYSLINNNLGFCEEKESRITSLFITNTRENLLVSLIFDGAFKQDIEKAILSGVVTTFSITVNLNKMQNYWFDEKIIDVVVTHTIKYDVIKNEFTIDRSWENGKVLIAKSFDKAKKLMSEISDLKVIALDNLKKNQAYEVEAKVKLAKFALPFYLHYIIPFSSVWDFETKWHKIDFVF